MNSNGWLTLETLCFVVCPSIYHVMIKVCDVGGRAPLARYEIYDTDRCFMFPIVLSVPESPAPYSNTQSRTIETPNGRKPLTHPNSEVASMLRRLVPHGTPT